MLSFCSFQAYYTTSYVNLNLDVLAKEHLEQDLWSFRTSRKDSFLQFCDNYSV